MKKVLIIANLFLGSPRMAGLIKYLPEYGWQPVLLAPAPPPGAPFPPGLQVTAAPYRETLHFWKRLFKLSPGADLRGGIKEKLGVSPANRLLDWLMTCAGAVINYPDYAKGWRRPAVKAANELLQREKIDAVISSSSPVTAHIIAAALKKNSALPWVADLRDPWSQNHNYIYGPLRHWRDKRLELRTLSAADALVTVSQPWADNLSELHHKKQSFSITNGYDPEMVNDPPEPLTPKFSLTHTGSIYRAGQDPSRLFLALKELIADGIIDPQKIVVRFYGTPLPWLDEEIIKYGLADIARQYGQLSKNDAIAKQRESHILLHFKWEHQNERGAYSGKIFEYFAAKRPIIVTGGFTGDVVDELLEQTSAGISCVTVEKIKETITALYSEYKTSGSVSFKGDMRVINQYSHREMSRRFSEILDRITAGKDPAGK